MKRNQDKNRRQWMAAAGRWGVAALVVAGIGKLWKRNGISLNRQTCVDAEGRLGCRQCGLLETCGHPKALSVRQVMERQG